MKNACENTTLRITLDNGKKTTRSILWYESLEYFMRVTGGKLTEFIYDNKGNAIGFKYHRIVDIEEVAAV